jgi:ribokinase
MGANADLTETHVGNALENSRGARILLTQLEIPLHVALFATRQAHRLGMITILNPAPAPEEPLSGLEAVDFLTPNETEARVLLGLDPDGKADPLEMGRQLRGKTGVGCVIITLGENGAVIVDSKGSAHIPSPKVTAVDSTGAGDAFNAGFATALLHNYSTRKAVEWACAVGAYSVTRPGTIPDYPTKEQVNHFLKRF